MDVFPIVKRFLRLPLNECEYIACQGEYEFTKAEMYLR